MTCSAADVDDVDEGEDAAGLDAEAELEDVISMVDVGKLENVTLESDIGEVGSPSRGCEGVPGPFSGAVVLVLEGAGAVPGPDTGLSTEELFGGADGTALCESVSARLVTGLNSELDTVAGNVETLVETTIFGSPGLSCA